MDKKIYHPLYYLSVPGVKLTNIINSLWQSEAYMSR